MRHPRVWPPPSADALFSSLLTRAKILPSGGGEAWGGGWGGGVGAGKAYPVIPFNGLTPTFSWDPAASQLGGGFGHTGGCWHAGRPSN